MATLTIRNLPDELHAALRVRAARNGRSMEAELREMIARGLEAQPTNSSVQQFDDSIRAAQADFAAYRMEGVLASEELIAERRLEAWRETVEHHREISLSKRSA
jgi:plasmid stability protein